MKKISAFQDDGFQFNAFQVTYDKPKDDHYFSSSLITAKASGGTRAPIETRSSRTTLAARGGKL